MTSDPMLVKIELAFTTTADQNAEAFGDRIREAVGMIVGREAVEEFRVRTLPLNPPKAKGGLRPVD